MTHIPTTRLIRISASKEHVEKRIGNPNHNSQMAAALMKVAGIPV